MKASGFVQRNIMNDEGFTLIELIIVIVILGIITSIAVPKYLDLTASVNQSADTVNKKSVEAAVLLYFAEQVAGNSSYTLKAAVNQYNTNSDPFFSDGNTPTKADGTDYSVSVVSGTLVVN